MTIECNELVVLTNFAGLKLSPEQIEAITPLFDTITATMRAASEVDLGSLAPSPWLPSASTEVTHHD